MKTTIDKCELCNIVKEVTKLQIEDEQHAFCEECFVKSAFVALKSIQTLNKMSSDRNLTEEQRKQASTQVSVIEKLYNMLGFAYKDISDESEESQ